MPIPGSGNFFQPDPEDGDQQQQPTAAVMSNLMNPRDQAMQPQQTPQDHASAKQGWLDWFKDPSTASFLLQFGASMLQPNPRGFGAQLGTSLGEAGQAEARYSEQQQATAKSQADIEEAKSRSALYGAQAKVQPELADVKAQLAQSKMDTASQMIWVNQQLAQARAAGDSARAEQLTALADQIQMKVKYPSLSQYQTEHEKWAELSAQGMLGPGAKEPQPEDYGVPRSVLGLPEQQFGAGGPSQYTTQNLPPYKDTPGFWNMVGGADAATRQRLAIEYVTNRKQISLDDWNAHVRALDDQKAAAAAASAPGTKGAGAGTVSRPPLSDVPAPPPPSVIPRIVPRGIRPPTGQ